MFYPKYLKYKNKLLALKKQFGGVTNNNLLYIKYFYLNLLNSDLESDIRKKEISEEFIKIYYFPENYQKGLPVLVSINPDIYAETKISPFESEELIIKIKKVHLLFQALKTGNLILFNLINNYWYTYPSIIEIWKTLPDNYKNTYDLLDESIKEEFIDIFKYLCGNYEINKDSYYKHLKSFNKIYEHTLFYFKNNSIQVYETEKFLNEILFYYLLPSYDNTEYFLGEKKKLYIYVTNLHLEILKIPLISEYMTILF